MRGRTTTKEKTMHHCCCLYDPSRPPGPDPGWVWQAGHILKLYVPHGDTRQELHEHVPPQWAWRPVKS
jgi:hypothetical protein